MPSSSSASGSGSGSAAKKGQLSGTEKMVYQAILAEQNHTMPQEDLITRFKSSEGPELMNAINTLMRKSLLSMQTTDKGYQYVAISKTEASLMGSLEGDEAMVYRALREAANEGLWSRQLRLRTGLHTTIINKCLKDLMKRSLIKFVRSVKTPTRKIYMLEHLTPSIEVSGGPWYTDNELDTAFISTLSNSCLRYIQQQTWPEGFSSGNRRLYPAAHARQLPNAIDVRKHLQASRITSVDLSLEDVRALLETLVYDEKVEKIGMLHGAGPSKPIVRDPEYFPPPKSSKRKGSSSKSKRTTSKKRRHRRRSREDESETENSDASDSESEPESSSESDSESDSDGRSRRKSNGKSRKRSSSKSKSRKKSSSKKRRSSRSKSRDTSSSSSDSDSEEDDYSDESSDDDTKSSRSNSSKAKSRLVATSDTDNAETDAEESHYEASLYVYRALRPMMLPGGFTETPCARCPVFDFCRPKGPVNAESCVYFDHWIDARIKDQTGDADGDEDGSSGSEQTAADDGDAGNDSGVEDDSDAGMEAAT